MLFTQNGVSICTLSSVMTSGGAGEQKIHFCISKGSFSPTTI